MRVNVLQYAEREGRITGVYRAYRGRRRAFRTRAGAKVEGHARTTNVRVPPRVLREGPRFVSTIRRFIVVNFALKAASGFASFQRRRVRHAGHLTILVLLRVRDFSLFQVIDRSCQAFRVLFGRRAFVLEDRISAPVCQRLRHITFDGNLFRGLSSFHVERASRVIFRRSLRAFSRALVRRVIRRFSVVRAIIRDPLCAVLSRLFHRLRVIRSVVRDRFQLSRPRLNRITQHVKIFHARDQARYVGLSRDHDHRFAFRLSEGNRTHLFARRVIVVGSESIFVLLRVVRIRNHRLRRLAHAFAIKDYSRQYVRVRRPSIVRGFVGNVDRIVAGARRHSRYVHA